MAKKQSVVHPTFQKQAVDYTETTNKLKAFLEEWIHTLGLGYWSIGSEYVPGINPERPAAAALCKSSFEYQWAEIKFYLVQLVSEPDVVLENTVIHELLHLLVRPMRTETSSIEQEEWVVTNLARSFISAKHGNITDLVCKKSR